MQEGTLNNNDEQSEVSLYHLHVSLICKNMHTVCLLDVASRTTA